MSLPYTRAGPVETGRELVEARLADEQRTGVDQSLYRRRGRVGDVSVFGAGERGREAGHVDAVLDAERDAVERQLRGSFARFEFGGRAAEFVSPEHGYPGAVVTA